MRKWKEVVIVFNIGPCPLWYEPTHSPFSVCFCNAFCKLMKVLKICIVWIHIHNCFERIVEYLLILSSKYTLCIFSRLNRYMCTSVCTSKMTIFQNIFFIILVHIYTYVFYLWMLICIFCSKSFKKNLNLVSIVEWDVHMHHDTNNRMMYWYRLFYVLSLKSL